MPRCQRIELADVAAWDNLEAALWLAARGKLARPDVAAFLANAQQGLQGIHAALLAGQMPEGTWRSFTIQDPKPRIIHAAPFADRVAHHALMRVKEPRLELGVAALGSTTRATVALRCATATTLAIATTTSAIGLPERLKCQGANHAIGAKTHIVTQARSGCAKPRALQAQPCLLRKPEASAPSLPKRGGPGAAVALSHAARATPCRGLFFAHQT